MVCAKSLLPKSRTSTPSVPVLPPQGGKCFHERIPLAIGDAKDFGGVDVTIRAITAPMVCSS